MTELSSKTLVSVRASVLTDTGERTGETLNTVVSLGELEAGLPALQMMRGLRQAEDAV